MEDYKPNSVKYNTEKKNVADKKVEKVVKNRVIVKKKTGLDKVASVFISEDAQNVKSYIVLDVLVPAIKKAILDIVTDGADMILYGGSHKNKHKSGGNISYRSYYDDKKDDKDYRSKGRFDYDDLVFDSRSECEAVREQMVEIIDQYGFVTVADMYDMADLPAPYTSSKYGWTNIRTAETIRGRDGYVLKLPKAMPID